MSLYDKLREWLCNWVYGDCIPPSAIAKEYMEEFKMTKNSRFELNCKLGLVNGEEPLCKCLLDNGKHKSYREWVDLLNNLTDENEQLKRELDEFKQPNCKKCMHYSVDGVGDYCMCEKGLLNGAWEMFPFEWDYTNAKNCKEYEE